MDAVESHKAMTNRPLSPHLQIYKPQLTSVLSILHRITGVALSVGTILLVYWLVAAASGPGAFATAAGFIGSWLGLLLLFGWTFALFFHLANGIRHLFWDAGIGFELKTVYASGWTVVAVATALTLISFIAGLAALGDFDAAGRKDLRKMTDHRTALGRARGLGSAKEGRGPLVGSAGDGAAADPSGHLVRRLPSGPSQRRLRGRDRLAA